MTKHRTHKTPKEETLNRQHWFTSQSNLCWECGWEWHTDRCLYSFCGWWLLSCRWIADEPSRCEHVRHRTTVRCHVSAAWGRDKPPWSVRGPCHDEFHIAFFCLFCTYQPSFLSLLFLIAIYIYLLLITSFWGCFDISSYFFNGGFFHLAINSTFRAFSRVGPSGHAERTCCWSCCELVGSEPGFIVPRGRSWSDKGTKEDQGCETTENLFAGEVKGHGNSLSYQL